MLEKSFNDIVIDNIYKVMGKFQAPTSDILLMGDFNFPEAQWHARIGIVKPDSQCNRKSLQKVIDLASYYILLPIVIIGSKTMLVNATYIY